MKFRFGDQSPFKGIRLNSNMSRFSYVPKSEEGVPEYILVFDEKLPTPIDEPQLYASANPEFDEFDEIVLHYPHTDAIVVLLTEEADNKFRQENAETISANELFVIEE